MDASTVETERSSEDDLLAQFDTDAGVLESRLATAALAVEVLELGELTAEDAARDQTKTGDEPDATSAAPGAMQSATRRRKVRTRPSGDALAARLAKAKSLLAAAQTHDANEALLAAARASEPGASPTKTDCASSEEEEDSARDLVAAFDAEAGALESHITTLTESAASDITARTAATAAEADDATARRALVAAASKAPPRAAGVATKTTAGASKTARGAASTATRRKESSEEAKSEKAEILFFSTQQRNRRSRMEGEAGTVLLVRVDAAEGLPTLGDDGTVDAYCSLELPGQPAQTTQCLPDEANPVFEEHFIFAIPSDGGEEDAEDGLKLSVKVLDRDADGGDDVLVGYVDIGFPAQPAINTPWENNFTLLHDHIVVRRNKKKPGEYIARQKRGTPGEVAHTPNTKFPLGRLNLTITWLSVEELGFAADGVRAAQAAVVAERAAVEAKRVAVAQLQKTAETVAAVAAASKAESKAAGDPADAARAAKDVEELTSMAQSAHGLEEQILVLEGDVAAKDSELEALHKAQEDVAAMNAVDDAETAEERAEEIDELRAELNREAEEGVAEARRRATASSSKKSGKATILLAKQRRKMAAIATELADFKRTGLSAKEAAFGSAHPHDVASLLVQETTEVIFGGTEADRFGDAAHGLHY